jgi:hypothetical protein
MRVEALNPGFSTADAEYPAIQMNAGVLTVTFTDWREQLVQVEFRDVCAFSWQEAEQLLPDQPYDGACEVHGSDWLLTHVRTGAVSADSGHRHLRFNFNECGQLEVICVSYAAKSPGSHCQGSE